MIFKNLITCNVTFLIALSVRNTNYNYICFEKTIRNKNMNRRLLILKNSTNEFKLGGKLSDWMLNTFAPTCSYLAKGKIKYVEEANDKHLKVFLHGINLPIFIPKSIGILALEHVIAEQFYKWNWHYYEIPETVVELGENVFDCGSAEGIFSLLTYERAGKVLAFEPLQDYYSALEQTFNNVRNVKIINSALGDKIGETFLTNGGIASTVSELETEFKIEINTLDSFSFHENIEVNYIKADIEGYEMKLLKGAQEVIFKYKPKIAVTIYHQQNNYHEIIEFLKKTLPSYKFKLKGVAEIPNHYVMLHAWV